MGVFGMGVIVWMLAQADIWHVNPRENNSQGLFNISVAVMDIGHFYYEQEKQENIPRRNKESYIPFDFLALGSIFAAYLNPHH